MWEVGQGFRPKVQVIGNIDKDRTAAVACDQDARGLEIAYSASPWGNDVSLDCHHMASVPIDQMPVDQTTKAVPEGHGPNLPGRQQSTIHGAVT